MKVNSVQSHLLLNNSYNNSKNITSSHVCPTINELPKGIDCKYYVNVSFRGIDELIKAVKDDDVRELKREIRKGTDINEEYYDDGDKTTALIMAVENECDECLDELLKRPELDVNAKDHFAETALICACRNNVEQVKKLLKHPNIDVNSYNDDCNTALIVAVKNSNLEIVKELLKHPNIDVNFQNDEGNDAIMEAWSENEYEIMDEIMAHPNTDLNVLYGSDDDDCEEAKTLLINMIEHDEIEDIKDLLECPGLNINTKSSQGNTALMKAVIDSEEEAGLKIMQALLEHPDIDVNIQNEEEGKTAIMLAVDLELDEYIEKLLERDDIDLTIKDNDGNTALDLAEENENNFYDSTLEALREKTEYQLEHPESIVKGRMGFTKKPPVDTEKLSPEENIWTKEEISGRFFWLVKTNNYDEAVKMLKATPLIDLEGDNNDLMIKVCSTGKPDFVEKVYDYKFHKQKKMQEEYDSQRKSFFGNTIRILSYDEQKANNITLNTIDGFKVLMENPEFNPNDTVEDFSLFERACILDPEGNLAKEILSKYGDVNTVNAAKIRNKVIKDLIKNYEEVGKYRIVLNKIEDNAFYADERRGIAANQLKELLESPEFTPEIADEVGNSVLHIAAALPDDMGRTLIQMALNKGIDINAGNCTGQRPLMSAIKKLVTTEDNAGKMNLMSNIKFLLDKGADINVQDNNGQTAFHFACMSTVAALLTLLLSHEPNVFLKDKMGNRAAKYLKTEEMKEIYQKYLMG